MEKYWGGADLECNLQHKEHSYITTIAHNTCEYDGYLLLLNEAKKECGFLSAFCSWLEKIYWWNFAQKLLIKIYW